MRTINNKQSGLSLIELMVAIMVSLILLAGASQLFLSTKQSYRVTEGLSRLQENGRFLMDILPRDVRQAGVLGCRSAELFGGNITNTLGTAGTFPSDFAVAVEGYRVSGGDTIQPAPGPTFPTSITGSVVSGTDLIVIRSAIDEAAQVTAQMGTNTAAVPVSTTANFAVGDTVAVTDCNSASIFQVTAINSGTLGHNASLGDAYGPESQVIKISTIAYYIRDSNGVPSLYRDIEGVSQELVPGVENMKVLYGVDPDGDDTANRYLPATGLTAADWIDVVAVRVALLLQAPDDNKQVTESRTYTLLDTTVTTPTDRFQRQIYSTTILLRNRALPDV